MERARWGWRAWTVPSDGTLPETAHHIDVIAPGTGRVQRAVLRWRTGRSDRRVTLGRALPTVRPSTLGVVIVSLFVGVLAICAGLAVDVALPAMMLVPLLTERPEERVDARDRGYVRRIQGEAACRYAHRLAVLQDRLIRLEVQGGRRYELRRAAGIGRSLLWDVAALLQDEDTVSASAALIGGEMLMLRLVDQAEDFSTCLCDTS
ncbi:hypothetical protein [Streptomyces fagopyri]|uniref:hypothetical protein n=1 Tax=Streptomyces fagopyri TaxID=2662397 RepID=UPI0033DADB7C